MAALVLALLLAAGAARAQSINIDLGAGGAPGATSRLIQLTALITGLSLAPSLLVMVTAFTRIIIVLSLLRGAIGLQGAPPNSVLIGLALFLTFHVMQPTFDAAWTTGLLPMTEGKLEDLEGLQRASEPFRRFMLANVRADDLRLFIDLAHLPPDQAADAAPWRALVPGFLVGALVAPLVFYGGFGLALIGVLLWGVSQGVHDAVMNAALSNFVPEAIRARAFGLFSAIYGIAWFAGSALLGVLYDHALPALVAVSAAAPLVALIPLGFALRQKRAAP
jgi:flagellar biosynthetic protein FliP